MRKILEIRRQIANPEDVCAELDVFFGYARRLGKWLPRIYAGAALY